MSPFEHDYYAILGLPSDADERAIKRAYRQLARRYHPDTSTAEQATEMFHEIQMAYQCLIDPVQREAYDHWRKEEGLDRPLPLALRVTPSQQTLTCLGESQLLYVLIEVTARDDVETQRLPLNLCLVLDQSTSMKGARMQQVKTAARYIVDQMGPDDVLSIVLFSDRAEVALPGRRGIEKAAARAVINGMRPGGGTELLQGLLLGLQQVERWHSEATQSHLVLLTDGQTYGDEARCREAAEFAGDQNIPLTLLGIGPNWNDKLLDEMAHLSHGPSASIYIDSNSKIAKILHDQIHSMGNLFARNLQLSIHLSDGVRCKEIFQVSPQIDKLFLVDGRVLLGSLEKGQPKAIMVELLVDGQAPGLHRLVQVDVEGIVSSRGLRPLRARQAIEVSFVAETKPSQPIPSDIVSAMSKLTIYKMQERAMDEIERGQIEPAVGRLKTLATRLLDIGETELARAALLEAGRLAQTGALSAEGRKKIRFGTRGLRFLPKEVRYD
jgi:Ca-activated chloride channel family protein